MSKQDDQTQDVIEQLAILEPGPTDAPMPARQAWTHLQQQIDMEHRPNWLESIWLFLFAPTQRVTFAAVFLMLTLGIALSFPTVRAAASEFLGLFRVQKFAAISISPEQIALLEQIAEAGFSPGELEIYTEPGPGVQVDSLNEARRLTGMETLRTLPQLGMPTNIAVTDGGNGRFIIDTEGTRAILEAAGVDASLIPAELNNAGVRITVFAGVEQTWDNGTMLMQTDSPIVEYPPNLDPQLLGSALLQILGMSSAEADRLSQQIDWTSTLLLPIPTTAATFNEVTVEGSSGIALTSLDAQFNALIWQRDGVIHLLLGEQTIDNLRDLANGLQ